MAAYVNNFILTVNKHYEFLQIKCSLRKMVNNQSHYLWSMESYAWVWLLAVPHLLKMLMTCCSLCTEIDIAAQSNLGCTVSAPLRILSSCVWAGWFGHVSFLTWLSAFSSNKHCWFYLWEERPLSRNFSQWHLFQVHWLTCANWWFSFTKPYQGFFSIQTFWLLVHYIDRDANIQQIYWNSVKIKSSICHQDFINVEISTIAFFQ